MGNCFECNNPADENHHVVPKSKGGTKTVPLCHSCHGLVHGVNRLNISTLTKAALTAKKARGEKLGNSKNFTSDTRAKGRAAHASNAANNQNTKTARGYATLLSSSGASLRTIANTLNTDGFKTARGGQYSAVQVSRLLK